MVLLLSNSAGRRVESLNAAGDDMAQLGLGNALGLLGLANALGLLGLANAFDSLGRLYGQAVIIGLRFASAALAVTVVPRCHSPN